MKLFSRVTNSFVMTAALLAVVIASLCFSVGEGLRLTPFPVAAFSQTDDSNTVVNINETNVSLSKYGPLDVPTQKRGKRSSIDVASGSSAGRELVAVSIVGVFGYEAVDLNCSPHIKQSSGRAPPFSL